MVDVGIVGGVSMISTRHAQPNSAYMGAFDAAPPTSSIIDIDANNLYGWAMTQPMRIGGFDWMTAAEAREIDWQTQTEDQPVGYFIEASIHSQVELHEAHNKDLLAAERLDLQVKMLRGIQVKLRTPYQMSWATHSTKLIPNLLPKSNYIVDYLNLRFYLVHGMRFIDLHRVLRFQQSRWVAAYFEKKSSLRAAAKNDSTGHLQADQQLDIPEHMLKSIETDPHQAHHNRAEMQEVRRNARLPMFQNLPRASVGRLDGENQEATQQDLLSRLQRICRNCACTDYTTTTS